jgi:hypothetical protein
VNSDTALVWVARQWNAKTIRPDRAGRSALAWEVPFWAGPAAVAGLALLFVILGAGNLDLGAAEGRLGLAAGERPGPLGQAFGYWAPDVWPGTLWPSWALGHFELGGRPTSAAIRWPAALAAVAAGCLVARSMARALGTRAGVMFGLCWFGSLAMIDRSAATGLELISALGLLAALDRMVARRVDFVAGLWLSLAFLAGGWPPVLLAALAVIAAGIPLTRRAVWVLAAPLIAIVGWSVATISASNAEVWAAALGLPLTTRSAWLLAPSVFLLGLPWSPFALLVFAGSVRAGWRAQGRPWISAWFQIAGACLIAGTLIPGLGHAASAVVLCGISIAAAAGISSAWSRSLSRAARGSFFALFSLVVALWLVVMLYGSFIWSVAVPFYRTLGVGMAILCLVVALVAAWALDRGCTRRALAVLVLLAIGVKLAHFGYYVPEWNYRFSQGPWARAVSQWLPRKWTLYTIHDWPADLAFFMKRPVRQLPGPYHLANEPGPPSKYVLLLPSELENWPKSEVPISVVVRLQDRWAQDRILARTPGPLPPPFGPNLARVASPGELTDP